MAVNSNRLNLTRDQLAAFLKDPKSIKQFERLFATADATQPETIDGVQYSADAAYASANAALSQATDLRGRVDLLEAAPPHIIPRQRPYGTFYRSTTQTAAAINTAYGVVFESTDLSLGVWLGTPTSRVYVANAGVYNFQFSAQLNKASGSAKHVYIWARISGVDQAASATQVTLAGSSSAHVAAWNFVYQMAKDDYFELMWSTDDTRCELVGAGAVAPVPSIPSVILTVTDNISV
jgi:hypothetical protein